MRSIAIFLVSLYMVGKSIICIAQGISTNCDPKTSSPGIEANRKQSVSDPAVVSLNQKSQQKETKAKIYIGDYWSLGTIVFRNGGVIDNYYLRYNLLTDQIHFIDGKDTLVFADPQELNTVSFDGHTFVYETYKCLDRVCKGYFELIVPGKNKLMLKRMVTSQKPDSKYPDNESLTKYQVDECYFISKPGMPTDKLVCNRKSALTYLNEHSEDISEYLRITGNKVRSIDDLKLLVSYYNSLDEEY